MSVALQGDGLQPAPDGLVRSFGARSHRGRLLRYSLAAADVVGVTGAFVGAALLTTRSRESTISLNEALLLVASLPGWIFVASLYALYDNDERRADHATADDLTAVFHLVTIGTWLLLAASVATGLAQPEPVRIVAFWGLAIALLPLTRTVARALCRRSPDAAQSAVIVGAGDVGQLLARKLLSHPEYGIQPVGFVDAQPKSRRADLPSDLMVIGRPEHLREIVDTFKVDRVIFAFGNEPAHETVDAIRALRDIDVQVDVVPRLFEVYGPKDALHSVEGMPLVGLPPATAPRNRRAVKRALDVVVSALALILLTPLFLFIAWRIRRDSPGPVFFRQTRIGQHQQEFTVLKFRTMKMDTDTSLHQEFIRSIMSASATADEHGLYKLDRADAVTPIGRWLRRTSLDELPQLINVLWGDMSLVGPRPCIPYELDHLQPHHFERFQVPQGMTGLWQVTARAHATFGEALDMDVAYVRGWSLALDLRLILRTPLSLVRQRGATA